MKAVLKVILVFAAALGAFRGMCAFQDLRTGPSIEEAERYYAQGNWLEAERRFTAILEKNGPERGKCYDRLLEIYPRLDRHDKTIHLALEYRKLLKKGNNRHRLRFLELELGRCYFALGHKTEAEKHVRLSTADDRGASLPPIARIEALQLQALCVSARGDDHESKKCWRDLEDAITGLLNAPKQTLTDEQYVEISLRMAESQGLQDKPDLAIKYLLPLLAKDKLSKRRDILRQLAEYHAAQKGGQAMAEDYLQQIVKDQQQDLTAADAYALLGDLLEKRQRHDQAREQRESAARTYGGVVGRGGTDALPAFWKLQVVQRKLGNFEQIQDLAAPAEWSGNLLLKPRLQAEEGNRDALRGIHQKALTKLRDSVKDMESQTPLNLRQLPRTLLNLARVEQLLGNWGEAEKRSRQCADMLNRDDHVLHAEVCNILGAAAAQQGKYKAAIDQFQDGMSRCKDVAGTDPLQCLLLLNRALVHKLQGDLDQADTYCTAALNAYERFAEPESLQVATFYAAQANIHVARKKFKEAAVKGERILEICKERGAESGPVAITAYHCQALDHLYQRRYADAEQAWGKVLSLQDKQAALLPRTLNYLALAAEMKGQATTAEKYYREALELQQTARAYPATYFITLWRLAHLLRSQDKPAEAHKLLEQAIQLAETTRLQTFGDTQNRAQFMAQFAPAFDELVSLLVSTGKDEAAMIASSRSRGLGLRDQLHMAGVDPRSQLTGTRGEELKGAEAQLKTRIAELRARAVSPVDDPKLLETVQTAEAAAAAAGPGAKEGLEAKAAKARASLEAERKHRELKLQSEFDKAQSEYANVWRDIFNESKQYRPLVNAKDSQAVLKHLRGVGILGPGKLLLAYHIGREQSWLFLVGADRTEAFPLSVNALVAERIGLPASVPGQVLKDLKGRGVDLVVGKQEEPPLPKESDSGKQRALGETAARALVDHYLARIKDVRFDPTRGFALKERKSTQPVPTQRLEILGQVFLPAAARQRIKESKATHLLVIPDGPLHKLPLEAVLIQAGGNPRYALDELPPMIYCPSAAVLAMLTRDLAVRPQGPLSLLTVGDVTFRDEKLPPLPMTRDESEGIRKIFPPGQAMFLEKQQATKKTVLAAMPGKRVIHLATHGFADEEDQKLKNLFGGLALAPESAGDDGFLRLHEIYALDLRGCDLAVLSACSTHVGPRAPLEAGATLANGFLTAGARRVVASHWPVADESTAHLMKSFFEELIQADRKNQALPYTQALHQARLKLRQTQPAPFYWAPFVLIGTPDR